jgi:radical SAM protein with 4Fe4S-binding SPASM domain
MYKRLIRLITPNVFNTSELFPSLLARYSSPKVIFNETLNQFFRLAHIPRAYKLTTVGIETNNTCNLECICCPVPKEMKREKGYMEFETFKKIIDLNPEIQRVYLTNWGEPLIHPDIIEMIHYAHSRGKQTALTTNGTLLDKSLTRELLESGLDIIKFSVDGGKETYQRVRGFPYEKIESYILHFIQMRNDLKKKTWVEVSMLIFNETTAEIDSFFIRWKNKADFVNIQPKFFTITKKNYTPCRELWRIMVVLWNGDVVPCCVDFDGTIVIGNAKRENLQSLFKNKIMREIRKKHLLKKPPSLCEKCSHYHADYYISKRKLYRAD